MKLKNFDNYTKFYSKDPLRFEKRVALASNLDSHPLFEKISNLEEMANLDREVPLIMWDNLVLIMRTKALAHTSTIELIYRNLPR